MYKNINTNFKTILFYVKNGVPPKLIVIYLITKIKNIIFKIYNKDYLKHLFEETYNDKQISETWSRNNLSFWCYLFLKFFNLEMFHAI